MQMGSDTLSATRHTTIPAMVEPITETRSRIATKMLSNSA